ncbi:MAG: thymidylate synthase, flavin-dependent [Spirochaetes bacterium GWB1_59_5]|nr:MAG: thymidylate synthase, flavin-dependent [Spirochaetes bacterium GWB1_59_5]
MLLVKPSAEILYINTGALQLIEAAGRTCYKSEDKITVDSAPKFAEMILKRGHESVVEHATATVRFICDRGVTHEIVRHRLASYSQESTRYCDYKGGHVSYIIPPWTSFTEGEYTNDVHILTGDYAETMWAKNCLEIEQVYRNLREAGWKPEQARSVLPNSLKTEIVMTANLREWRHFFKLRTSAAAHPQMREVAIPLLAEMKARIPVIFDGLVQEYL